MWCEQDFLSFQVRLFGGYDGFESGDRGYGWCGAVGVVVVICGVGAGV